jgi:hypothetical protein
MKIRVVRGVNHADVVIGQATLGGNFCEEVRLGRIETAVFEDSVQQFAALGNGSRVHPADVGHRGKP